MELNVNLKEIERFLRWRMSALIAEWLVIVVATSTIAF